MTTNPYARLLWLLLALTSLAGCSGSDKDKPDDPQPQPASPGEVRWTVDGTGYVAGKVAGQVTALYRPSIRTGAPATEREVVLAADDDQTYQISLSLANFTGVGTYTFVPNELGGTLKELQGSRRVFTSYYASNNPAGQVVVTAFDPNTLAIKGTFSFQGRAQDASGAPSAAQQVSNGTFELSGMLRQ